MYFRAIAGIVAGLCAGVVSGIMFLLMRVPEADGITFSVLTVISRAVGSNDPAVGWSYHLFNAALMGLVFGFIVGKIVDRLSTGIGLGLVTAVAAWLLMNLGMFPRAQVEAGAPSLDNIFSPLGTATLIGYAVQGVLLGVIYLWVYNPIRVDEYRTAHPDGVEDEQLVSAAAPHQEKQ
jgi:hypothetical protein